MKILHLIFDHQVIERTLDIYESLFPGCNEVIIISITDNYKHIVKYKNKQRICLGYGKSIGKKFDFDGITHIIAHYMSMDAINFIKSAPSYVRIIWEIYGSDLYNQFLSLYGYKLFYTNPTKFDKHKNFKNISENLFDFFAFLKGNKHNALNISFIRKRNFEYIYKRTDEIQYCCKYDSTFVELYAKRKIPSYEIFNYSLTEVLGDLKDKPFFEGNDIMVGNSASYSNNHFYVLEYLKTIDLKDSKLILPLSYGGSIQYGDEVEKGYINVFGKRVETLRRYLPLHEYNNTFLRLRAMFLSAWRQESQGTAIMGFYLGVKVYMSLKNPLYNWFKDCGFVVFDIETISNDSFITPLSLEEKKHNRNLVVARYNESVFEETLKSHFS